MNPAQIFTAADWSAVAPAFVLGIAGLVILVADLIAPTEAKRLVATTTGVVGLIVSGWIAWLQWPTPHMAFGGAFAIDGFGIAFSEISIVATILSLLLTAGVGRDDQVGGTTALMLWSACGALLMAGATNLLMVFLGLELLSLALYCLCAMAPDKRSSESALKYLILSSMASGFLIYGLALLFGATGSVSLAALAAAPMSGLLALGAGLLFVGLAFKLSLVPFHGWAPDVFEGAPLAVTAYMSVVTKAGVLAVLARFTYEAFNNHPQLLIPLWIVAAISMIFGNLGALAQTDMKRLLAYSGIAQVGYIVATFAGSTTMGLRYAIFYLGAYTFMNLGAFGVVALLSRENDEGSQLASFAGLGYRRPLLAALMTFFLLALAGLPPTVGFTGKILILAAQVDAGYLWLAAVLIVGTAISLYAYAKVIRVMYTRVDLAHVPQFRSPTPTPWFGVVACAVLVFVLGLYPIAPSAVIPLVK